MSFIKSFLARTSLYIAMGGKKNFREKLLTSREETLRKIEETTLAQELLAESNVLDSDQNNFILGILDDLETRLTILDTALEGTV